eukprot:TRINITY_DN16580_c0_g1_i1.p1 TRINITY_DN16580_c0_g1~~TRINITY_DN16580_c0_g1_i1.p1  ORF type:complete len:125 (-),score=31.87 TRINITY_DN16580_c0_g1_i1:67-405(-)
MIEELRQCTVIVEDFRPESQAILNSKMNRIIEQLATLDSMGPLFQQQEIPEELINFVDQKKNPDRFTLESLEAAKMKNQTTKGKIEGYELFKSTLEEELRKRIPTFPKLESE